MDYGKTVGEVEVKREIFQGNLLSPLLFVLPTLPLTIILIDKL